MTTQPLNPVTHALIKIGEYAIMDYEHREAIRELLQTLYLQGRKDEADRLSGTLLHEADFEARAEDYCRAQGWTEPA